MIAPAHVAFRALQGRRRPDCQFSELNTHPTYSPVYASPCTSRCPAQNSGPSGSLVLSRKNFAFSASCRFSPAHCNGLFSPVDVAIMQEYGALVKLKGIELEFTRAR